MKNAQTLFATAKAMVASNKGILAMDESTSSCNSHFAKLGIAETAEQRRAYREMIVTTHGLNNSINAAILSDETVFQLVNDDTSFIKALTDQGIIPGIKVDTGTKTMAGFPGEKITEGLDGLRQRIIDYAHLGLRFAKWRAVIAIGQDIPSRACIETNMQDLAHYAAVCQEVGMVTIVEPEVLMKGSHTLEQSFVVTKEVLSTLFMHLSQHKVMLEGLILKASMVVSGEDCPNQATVGEVADATVECLLLTVPKNTAGVAFLSGGQSGMLACKRLNAMHTKFASQLPWPLTFSFARAIQQPALSIWQGEPSKVTDAQQALQHRAECSKAASSGTYDATTEITILIAI